MKKTNFGRKSVLGAVLSLGLAFSAHAVDTWTYTGVSGNAGTDTTTSGNSLTTTGAFVTNNGTNGVTGNWSTNTVGTPSAALQWYSGGGLGMGSDGTGTPNHALDNNGSYTEGVLLSFSTSVMLTGIDLGYISGDADISVFRYTGSVAPTLDGTGGSLTSMTSKGWQLVGNYANLTQDNSAPLAYNLINGATDAKETPADNPNTVIPTASSSSVGSSWWLITAYNTAYGTGTGLTQGDDYFKLLAVAGTNCGTGNTKACGPTNKAPEPGSLALMGLSLFGLVEVRRRKALRKD